MMSLIDLDDEQRWVPTHVNVTVLRARGLRTKGKHGSRYLYTIIQVGKDKYTTGLVEKAEVPEWGEECCFELLPGVLEEGGRSAYPARSGDLVLTVMHRVLIGLDVFLGQAIIPLDKMFQEGVCPRDEWFKLHSKAGRKEKERGELQVTVQFTRNNMTASMYDLTMKDKPRSAFGKFKDRVIGKKKGDVESSSAIVPGRYAALSGSLGQPFGEEEGGELESRDREANGEKRSKVKDFFKGRLRKSSDTRSCSSLASESSLSSMASDNLGPPPSLDLLSDPPSSPIYTSKVRADALYGETDLAKKVLTSQHTTKIFTHKRAFSDDASKITTGTPRSSSAVESLKGQTMTQSKSSLCINGSHIYDSEPSTPKSSGALPTKLALLEKCSPLSRSLQNLTKRSDDKGNYAEGRRWSFDKSKKDEKEEEKEPQEAQSKPTVSSASSSPDKGRKLRKTLFSAGRSDSLPVKTDQAGSVAEGRLRGWFGTGDSQNKPRLDVSPMVESSSDVHLSLPRCPPAPPALQSLSPSASPSSHGSFDNHSNINLFTPSTSPSSNPLSPSNPFLPCMQRNPFFEELVAEELERSPCAVPCSPGSPLFLYTALPTQPYPPNDDLVVRGESEATIKRDRPRPVAKQVSLPVLPSETGAPNSPMYPNPISTVDKQGDWDESFDAFASSRLNSPKSRLLPEQPRTSPTLSSQRSCLPADDLSCTYAQELQTRKEQPPPLPPRRLVRTSTSEVFSDGWLHRGQELAVHQEAYLLSQTGVASLQCGREAECKRNSISPSQTPESLKGQTQLQAITSLGYIMNESSRRFKYEPLGNEFDCWGGTLFEQDLYRRVCRKNYTQQRYDEETAGNVKYDHLGSKSHIDTASDDCNIPASSLKMPNILSNPAEDSVDTNLCDTTCLNNNISFSLTLGDLNMNVSNSDFGFIDSESSSQSDVADAAKSGTSPVQDSQMAAYHQETTPEDLFTLKDTYITIMNSSFEIPASSNKLCKVSPVCQDCQSELDSEVPQSLTEPKIGISEVEIRRYDVLDVTKEDDNGNPQNHLVESKQAESFSRVSSARIRPRGASRQSSSDSPNNQSKSADREFEQFLSLVQSISEVSEGPLSYQPTKSLMSSLQALEETDKSNVSFTEGQQMQTSPKGNTTMSFEDLHAKVAPTSRIAFKSKIGKSLPEPESCPPPTPSARSLSADSPVCCPPIQTSSMGPGPKASILLAGASDTPSQPTTSTTDQPLVDARHPPLPEETRLSRQESRPHLVKPLTSSQPEKKEGRSVLEKLKSTINPGRTAHQMPVEPEKSQEVSPDRTARYQSLTNMELISLLLHQEMDLQKQQAASEQQGAQLEKCESELRKVKAQVRDLEDYIDNLLLRIMEQTPTLLQVRSRHK